MCFTFAFQDHFKCAPNADSGSASPLVQMAVQGETLQIVSLCGSSPCGEFELVVPQHCLRSVGLAAKSTAVQLKVPFSQMALLITGMLVTHTSSSSNLDLTENKPS